MKIIEKAKNRFWGRAGVLVISIYLVVAVVNLIYQTAKGNTAKIVSASPGRELMYVGLFLLLVMAVMVIYLWGSQRKGGGKV